MNRPASNTPHDDPLGPLPEPELARLSALARSVLPEPAEPGLALRLALRVRDQVAAEERAERRPAAPRGWARVSPRARIRLVLASLGVHVAVLGWVVFRERAPEPEAGLRPVHIGRAESHEPLPRVAEGPVELPPVVPAAEVPDDLLARQGLESLTNASSGEVGLPEVPGLAVRVPEHPQGVGFEMLRRLREPVKARRLERLGVDPAGTREAVARGLAALAARQGADGGLYALDGADGRSEAVPAPGPVGRTALALLPFLAEGRASTGPGGAAGDPVVERGLAFVRRGLDAAELPSDALALAVLALSEDYMLSYGRWTPGLARERAGELARLTGRLVALQRDDGAFPGADAGGASPWPVLALDAAAHTGVVLPPLSAGRERLARWLAARPRAASGLPAAPDGSADLRGAAAEVLLARSSGGASLRGLVEATPALADGSATGVLAGLALYRHDPAAFRTLGQSQARALHARLGRDGAIGSRDVVHDTALVLLALQSAYRLY